MFDITHVLISMIIGTICFILYSKMYDVLYHGIGIMVATWLIITAITYLCIEWLILTAPIWITLTLLIILSININKKKI